MNSPAQKSTGSKRKVSGSEAPSRAEYEALADALALALVVVSEMARDIMAGPLERRLEIAARSGEFESSAAGIRALLGRFEKVRRSDGARQRRAASDRGNVLPSGLGRNY